MIKINLLSEGRKPVAAKKRASGPAFSFGGVDAGSAALLGALAIALLVSLGHNFLLGRKISSTQDEIAVAQAEVDRLAPIIAEVEQFKAKKAKLENKVDIIGQLKANQQGPVQIMDKISRALPELLWLNRMETQGQTITLAGQAFNTNAVANLLENLDRVPEFQEPVLQDTSQAGQTYNFVVQFGFVQTPTEDGEETAATAG
ncbi:MAG: PilN domain-containing protein [Acidobacteriota bacterium]|nr:PilN domain-containing protein [Acidobacteriota bacterium]